MILKQTIHGLLLIIPKVLQFVIGILIVLRFVKITILESYNKGDLHGGKTTMLYLNLSGH